MGECGSGESLCSSKGETKTRIKKKSTKKKCFLNKKEKNKKAFYNIQFSSSIGCWFPSAPFEAIPIE
jgi:hypothetical protein